MHRIAGVLTSVGYNITLVGRVKKNSVELNTQPFKQVRLQCWFRKGKGFYLEYNLRLLFFLLRTPADIYSAVDLDTVLPSALVAAIKRKKLAFDAHEYFTEVPEVQNRPLTKAVWNVVARICIPGATLAYTVGPGLAELFTKKYRVRFETIMNVPNYEGQPAKRLVSGQPIIIYQGALNEGRGLAQLIAAMKQVDALLIIAGDGDIADELKQLAAVHELRGKVEFAGPVKPTALRALTAKATIACNLLEARGLSYQYSLANKFFDYVHAGVPQLCANFVEYRNINSKHEVAVLCNCNEREIVDGLNRLLNDKELYARLNANCAGAAREYCLQNESEKLIRLYRAAFT